MASVAIIFTRYNNEYQHLMRYPEDPRIEYIMVDDGSTTDPVMPDYWKVYKITEDIGWNSEGAKNLGMQVMSSDWGLTCDLDHPIYISALNTLLAAVDILPPKAAYNPVRSDGKCINSYLCRKDVWWDANGYDETYTGTYGYDWTLKSALQNKGYPVLSLPSIGLDIVASGRSMSRPQKNALKLEHERESTDERIRFPWKRLQ